MKKVSIIVPVFNEENIIEPLLSRLLKCTGPLPYDFEFVFVDDGSSDGTLDALLKAQAADSRIKIVRLSRNWGYQNAFNAGLDQVDADAVIFMDGDLEDPPEVIPEFLKKWETGSDVVYAVKETRQESRLKKVLFSAFYRLMDRFSTVHVHRQSGMFSLVDGKVVPELKKCRERNKYYVGLRSFVGFKAAQVTYNREKRHAGRPKQTLRRLLTYAMDAFFAFSFFPIRVLTYFGVLVLAVIVLFTCILVAGKIFNLRFWFFGALPGWTSVVLIAFFILATQIIFMGILGEYIARIFDEVRNRPYYIVEKVYQGKKEDKDGR